MDEEFEGYQRGDSFDLVTPAPVYEEELTEGEQANSDFVDQLEGQELLDDLQAGGYVIYFRHAMTERDFADQVTADVTNFSTQRVLSEFGIQQSLAIGEGFEVSNIPYDDVITSEYGRAIKTAAIAFGEYQKDSALNFLPFEEYTDEQIEQMRVSVTPFLTAVPEEGTNTIVVGHDDLFEAGAGIYPDPQGIAYLLKPDGNGEFDIIANLLPEEWVELSGATEVGVIDNSITIEGEEVDGWSPGDSFDLVTPAPVYEEELTDGEQANSDFVDQLEGEELLDALQDGGYVIYFRHARTERDFADQVTADVDDFSTQRVVSEFGVQQSLAIGEGFALADIPYDNVTTSDYARAVETAAIAFGEYEKDSALNFLPFEDYTDEQIEEMRVNVTPFLTAVPEEGTNNIVVGHDDLFEAGTGIYPDPQGIAYILEPDGNGSFEVIANLLPEEWVELSEFNTDFESFVRFQSSDTPGTYLYATGAEADSIRANSASFVEEGSAFNAAIEPDDDLIVLNRFQNSDLPGTYLYAGEEESQSIRANFPNFVEEGPGFYAYGAGAGEETPFYRFQNSSVPGTYIYATGAEADNIRANFPNFIEEGIAFEAEI